MPARPTWRRCSRGVDDSERPRMRVVYFADRQQYNQALRTAIPKIDMTIGLYLDTTRSAYFFAAPDGDDRTLYHEATHQLFHESRPVVRDVGRRANFWIIEGIALYMESLRREGNYYVLGGVDDLRFHAAQYRLLNDRFYVPLEEITVWGMEKIQQHEKIGALQPICRFDVFPHPRRRRPLPRCLGGLFDRRV